MAHYTVTDEYLKEAPVKFLDKLRFLGPGFVLSASIVGSGELIATTILGAEAGFVVFWIVILSCLIKVAIQLEFGKRAILYGETAIQSFDKLRGKRFGKANWASYLVFFMMLLKIIQLGGMLGGTAVILNLLFPSIPNTLFLFGVAFLASILIYKGYYQIVEKGSLAMILTFTITTLTAVFMLGETPYAISYHDILTGFTFTIPADKLAIIFGAFGLTGVAADEVIAYTYWCIEKGYAAYTGPRDDCDEWKKRAKGWIKVMYMDAFFAMIIYTLVTSSFFLLGAAILHGKVDIPRGNGVIETLAEIYTNILGPQARTFYLIGAAFVLFSSVFATLAIWGRLFSDLFGRFGWIDFHDDGQRKKIIRWFSWLMPLCWVAAYLFINMPVLMIISGGIIGSLLLLLVVFTAIGFKKEEIPGLKSSRIYDFIFWLSVIAILGIGIYGILKLIL